jgi:uncharacterized protein YndB with AHSA1/START domain
METRRHVHEEPFSVSPERMFETLITPSAIRSWWGASKAIVTPKIDGVWIATWGDDEDAADYVSSFKIKAFEPPKRLLLTDGKYQAKSGQPPFELRMTAEFVIEPWGQGCTLRVINDGFPVDEVADDFYDACLVGWQNTFEGIRKYFFDNPNG